MGLTLDELLASVEDATSTPVPEDGWLTAREWAQHWDCPQSKARDSIQRLLAAGKMEWSRQPRQTAIGYWKHEPVYRLVGGEGRRT